MLRYLIPGYGRLRSRRRRHLLNYMLDEGWDHTEEYRKIAGGTLLGDELEIDTLAMDLNGTLTVDGAVVPGVASSLAKLQSAGLRLYIITGDVRGTARRIVSELARGGVNIELLICKDARGTAFAKLSRLLDVGLDGLAYIGNGQGDALAVRAAAFSVVTTQAELSSAETIAGAVGHATCITHALTGLLDEKLMCASFHQ